MKQLIQNITAHPKTTVLGLLSAAGMVVGLLTSQGVTGGHLGTGTVVGFAGALVAGLTGMVARDPGN